MSNDFPISPELAAQVADQLNYNSDGLIAAIAQQHDDGEVLMMAWMNRDAVVETLTTGRVCYFSRSRAKLWRKGESSGQVQSLVDFRWDCDSDTVLALVDQKGVACHTGRRNCFYKSIRNGEVSTIAEVEISPDELYG
ncbi:phosphoribosyl-AMP cyclohydrolase [Magnetovibrio sp.]|uniref:phosphoribosyl-AMP cyclohydrolase n=1 Tax=Magnetovibrio sp. TaxID=2024836 RepID=UPI002F95E047